MNFQSSSNDVNGSISNDNYDVTCDLPQGKNIVAEQIFTISSRIASNSDERTRDSSSNDNDDTISDLPWNINGTSETIFKITRTSPSHSADCTRDVSGNGGLPWNMNDSTGNILTISRDSPNNSADLPDNPDDVTRNLDCNTDDVLRDQPCPPEVNKINSNMSGDVSADNSGAACLRFTYNSTDLVPRSAFK